MDSECHLVTADSHVLNKVFGCGLAYPIRTKDGLIDNEAGGKPNPRADSFSLYLKVISTKLLNNLLPK